LLETLFPSATFAAPPQIYPPTFKEKSKWT
jgi:hypothetical protein